MTQALKMSDMLWHNINIMKKKKATLSEQFKSPIKFVDIEISLLDRVGKGIPIIMFLIVSCCTVSLASISKASP